MSGKIILVSDDIDFYEFILPKLSVKNYEHIIKSNFDSFIDNIDSLENSIIIVNSENNQNRTLELLTIISDSPIIVFSYNYDEQFMTDAYNAGMFSYITLTTSDKTFKAILQPAIKYLSLKNKNERYRKLLVLNKVIDIHNEIYHNSKQILEHELLNIDFENENMIIAAICSDEKSKFTIHYNQIETIILNNIRDNDIVINYAPHKYFILFKNIEFNEAETTINNILKNFPLALHAGISLIRTKNCKQVINDVLYKLQLSINNKLGNNNNKDDILTENFKLYREEFNKKILQVISPVFYNIQQVYNYKLFGIEIEQNVSDGCSTLTIESRKSIGQLKITSPGFNNINIDISIIPKSQEKPEKETETKRITVEPKEFEIGFLEDLLEQFIVEFKKEIIDDNAG